MVNGSQMTFLQNEMERDAYNAVFNELEFSWSWDSDTYNALQRHGSSPAERIHHYLETRQPHLLKAYDGSFLVNVIQEKKERYAIRRTDSGMATS
jgi:hypothetical protein